MKIKKHIVAAALAVGLVGSSGAVAPNHSTGTEVGYYLAKYTYDASEKAQGISKGVGMIVGTQVVGRTAAWAGARVGGTIGSFFGPVGAVVGFLAGAA